MLVLSEYHDLGVLNLLFGLGLLFICDLFSFLYLLFDSNNFFTILMSSLGHILGNLTSMFISYEICNTFMTKIKSINLSCSTTLSTTHIKLNIDNVVIE